LSSLEGIHGVRWGRWRLGERLEQSGKTVLVKWGAGKKGNLVKKEKGYMPRWVGIYKKRRNQKRVLGKNQRGARQQQSLYGMGGKRRGEVKNSKIGTGAWDGQKSVAAQNGILRGKRESERTVPSGVCGRGKRGEGSRKAESDKGDKVHLRNVKAKWRGRSADEKEGKNTGPSRI